MNDTFVIEPLSRKHQRQDFDCGEQSLDQFLKEFARQNNEKGLGRTYVIILAETTKVLGYYTISSSSIEFDSVPERLPKYPIPTVLIGRLAVDRSVRGHGLGELLLLDAFRRAVQIADEIGIYAIEVVALNEAARNFYKKFGFEETSADPFHLYIPMKTIRRLNLT